MATVYLARDLRHDRDVAIKVLRGELTSILGADRFLSEIRTTANLQHPNILPLFDSGELTLPIVPTVLTVPTVLYYVMPYVEGETLRDRLEREGQLPVDDAVRLLTEIAGALDYAHRKGIIHRDIKPENILLHDGRAIVADFGIALAASRAGGTRLTETGFSLGTPHYMSPEQAMGERQITARSDIFSLGSVGYEMLSGEPPFAGASAQAVVARVLSGAPPPLRTARPSVPPGVAAAIRKALERVPADRWRSAAEFAAALERKGDAAVAPSDHGAGARHGARRLVVPIAVALVALAAAGTWGARRLARPAPPAGASRLVLPLEPGVELAVDPLPFAISADGSAVVYSGESGGRTRLFLRPLASFDASEIPGTDGAHHPFFSPDGQWIGFLAGGKLQKVRRDGGAPIPLTRFTGEWGGAEWGRDGTIIYAAARAALYRVSAQGGRAEEIPVDVAPWRSSLPDSRLRWPARLPGGRHLLVSMDTTVAVVTLATGELRPLIAGRQARYLPTGHLLYDETEGRIRVAPFDARRLAITGAPQPAFEAFRSPGRFASQFTVSDSGTLLYVAGGFERSLVLTDSTGRESPLALAPRGYRFPRFSPDGTRLAVTVDPRPSEIWMVDLHRASAVPVVTGGHSLLAEWSPDGTRLAFFHRGITSWIAWPGADPPRPALAKPVRENLFLSGWTPRGLLGVRFDSVGRHPVRFDLGDSAPTPIRLAEREAWSVAGSPDGAWIAYVSDASGVAEIYVRPFDGGGEPVRVSVGGGADPHWTADGSGLIYRSGNGIMRVDVRLRPGFETAGRPRELFSRAYDFTQERNWDLSRDGRFIFVRADPRNAGRLQVVANWFTELRR